MIPHKTPQPGWLDSAVGIGPLWLPRLASKSAVNEAAATIITRQLADQIGGPSDGHRGWRWVFYINLPIGLVCTFGVLVFICYARNVRRERFDIVASSASGSARGGSDVVDVEEYLPPDVKAAQIWLYATASPTDGVTGEKSQSPARLSNGSRS